MFRNHVLLVVLFVFVAAAFLASCNVFSPENRAEVLTQQNCLRGCIDRCPQELAGYQECATRCGQICTVAGREQQQLSR
jgi:hypothetical protein